MNQELDRIIAGENLPEVACDLDYLLWALSTVLSKEAKETTPQTDLWRRVMLATWVRGHRSFKNTEITTIAEFARLMYVDAKLFAQPAASQQSPRVMFISRTAELTAGDIDANRRFLGNFLRSLCAGMQLDELAWGSQLSERTICHVFNGRKTTYASVARFACAAGFRLHCWFTYAGCTVGSAEFCQRFSYATPRQYKNWCGKRTRDVVSNAAFLQCIFGDLIRG